MEAKVAPLPRSYPVRLRALKRWEEDVMPDAGSFKRSSDSYVDSGSNSFHGVSHPPEPIDIDLMRPVYVPIGQDKGNGKCLESVRRIPEEAVTLPVLRLRWMSIPYVHQSQPRLADGEEPEILSRN
nr:serine/threonine-protein kinase D6PKL1 [Ipomoea batatas]